MNKPSKSKAEGDPSTYNPMTEKEMASLRRDILAESRANSDIIARMEENQARFRSFPSLLVSSENERRLQLNDTPPESEREILRCSPPFDAQAEHENDLRCESLMADESEYGPVCNVPEEV